MKIRKISGFFAAVLLLAGAFGVSAAALDTGVYTGTVTTTYTNPDTGEVDDGGTANAALGEGMCRSATAETGLVEVDADGNIWLTIRLLLQSNCKDVALYTRTDYNTYTKADCSVTAEDAANDSVDYRFQVTDAGVKLKGTMYVNPMGRDVLWYLYIDTTTLAEGSGDFVVTIDPNAKPSAKPAATSTPAAEKPAAATQKPAVQAPAAADAKKTENAKKTDEAKKTEDAKKAEDTKKTDEAKEESAEQTPETQEERIAAAKQRAEERASQRGDDADTAELAPETKDGGVNVPLLVGIAVVVLLAVGGAVYVILKKRGAKKEQQK